MLSGELVDISDAGLCIRANRLVEQRTVLRLKVTFPNVPAPVPLLAQVRWVTSSEPARKHRFRLGLVFVI